MSASKCIFSILGPRFVLNPIRMFEGSFGGPTLYQNPNYVSPNEVSMSNVIFLMYNNTINFLIENMYGILLFKI
jgi:hypothetical protein